MTSTISENFAAVRQRVVFASSSAGRDSISVTLLAVTKFQPISHIKELAALGATHFAESRVQEALDKLPLLASLGEWHFIGHLQSNKARVAAELFQVIESVDSVSLAHKLSQLGQQAPRPLRIFAQVNISREPQKYGLDLEKAQDEVAQIAALPGLSLEGLMGMAAPADDPEQARPAFKALAQLRERLRPSLGPLKLSMGMSDDFEVAIQEGSDIVRVGSALFKGLTPLSDSVT